MSAPLHILLTGSSTGIGRALASHLLGARATEVWGLARSDQSGFAAAHPDRFRHSRCDVGDWDRVLAASEQESRREWQHSDRRHLPAPACRAKIGRTVATDPARWSATVRANLDGTYHAVRAGHPLLQGAARRAKIVCFSGGGATKARANFSAYGVAKTGIVRLVETIAEEERARALDINALAPGAINTRLTEEVLTLGPTVVGETEYASALETKTDRRGLAGRRSRAGGMAPLARKRWHHRPADQRALGSVAGSTEIPRPLAAGEAYTLRRGVP